MCHREGHSLEGVTGDDTIRHTARFCFLFACLIFAFDSAYTLNRCAYPAQPMIFLIFQLSPVQPHPFPAQRFQSIPTLNAQLKEEFNERLKPEHLFFSPCRLSRRRIFSKLRQQAWQK